MNARAVQPASDTASTADQSYTRLSTVTTNPLFGS
jgi:hypothetical protein